MATHSRKPTLVDVAARANVDRSVVSRVLSGDARLNVRPATRERVLVAVAELGYRPNTTARSLRTARAHTYGLLIPDFTNPVYAAIITGAQAAAAAQGCLLLTGSSAGGSFGVEEYVDLLSAGRVDGLLLAGTPADGDFDKRLGSLDLPWLLLNRRTPSSRRYLVLDDERAAALAVEHLVGLGHRRIAHLAGPPQADTAARRQAGYAAALERAGLERDARLVVAADYTNEGGAAAMGALLALPDPPTAVFVANVASAIGALWAARDAGLVVPDDVSVVAVHDLPLAGYLEPPLTTVRMPLEHLGRRGIELLSSVPPDAPIAEVIAKPVELVLRRSTGPPRVGDPR